MTEKNVEKRHENSENHDTDHSKLDLRATIHILCMTWQLRFRSNRVKRFLIKI